MCLVLKEMATYSGILAWRIPWTEELGGLQCTGHKQLNTTERLSLSCNGLEEEIVTHSGILAWRIPWTEEPGGLQPSGLEREGP